MEYSFQSTLARLKGWRCSSHVASRHLIRLETASWTMQHRVCIAQGPSCGASARRPTHTLTGIFHFHSRAVASDGFRGDHSSWICRTDSIAIAVDIERLHALARDRAEVVPIAGGESNRKVEEEEGVRSTRPGSLAEPLPRQHRPPRESSSTSPSIDNNITFRLHATNTL